MSDASQAYTVSTNKGRLDLDRVYHWLSEESYWAQGRSRELVSRSIEHSLAFGTYLGDEQVGFARAVTDCATFAWLCDVFVAPAHRGRGVGKLLVQAATEDLRLCVVRLMLLATRDAHSLYETYGGFHVIERPGGWMIRRAKGETGSSPRAR
jgi:GNAT superfamily N-acetyltransferase